MPQFKIRSEDPTGRFSEAGPMDMAEALQQAPQLRAGVHQFVMLHDVAAGISTPIDEFDELD